MRSQDGSPSSSPGRDGTLLYLQSRVGDAMSGCRVHVPEGGAGNRAVLFLPGRWHNSRPWARLRPARDLRTCLVGAGVVVATVDYRTAMAHRRDIPTTAIASWRTIDFLDDIMRAIDLVTVELSIDELDLVGFSLGAAFAFLTAAFLTRRSRWRGAIVALDGGLKSASPTGRYDLEGALAANSNKVVENPAWEPRFRRPALAAVRASGRAVAAHRRSLADDPDYLRALLAADRFWPAAQISEMEALADDALDPALSLDVELRAIRSRILCVSAVNGSGRGARALASALRTSATSIDRIELAGWGHFDVLAGPRVETEVNCRVTQWLERNR